MHKKGACFFYHIAIGSWGFDHDRRYLTPIISSHPIDLCLDLILVELEQWLPSVERGAWLDCLRVVSEVCLKKKPWGASIPRMSLVHHKKKSGHIIITHLLFLTVLQLDVRHLRLHGSSNSPESTLNNDKKLHVGANYTHLVTCCWK